MVQTSKPAGGGAPLQVFVSSPQAGCHRVPLLVGPCWRPVTIWKVLSRWQEKAACLGRLLQSSQGSCGLTGNRWASWSGWLLWRRKMLAGPRQNSPPFGFPSPLLLCGSCSGLTARAQGSRVTWQLVAAGPGPALFPSTPWGCCFFSPDIAEGIITSGKFLGFPEVWIPLHL